MIKYKTIDSLSEDIWRIFISGSSSAGKTYFAKQLLSAGLMRVDRIYYFHPDIQEDFPVDWCDYFKDIPIVCESGLPSQEDLNDMPPYSVVVLDDQFTECAESKLMSYLFRVLSSKKKLHLMIMTQRYYDMGSKGLNIRNCSNYHVLMSNTDVRTNHRVGFSMGLDKQIKLAEKINQQKLYPYIVIDRTNNARVNGLQVYTDILSKHKEVIVKDNVYTVISAPEFKRKHDLSEDGFARKKPKMEHLDLLEDSLSDTSDSEFNPSQYSEESEEYSSESESETVSSAWNKYFQSNKNSLSDNDSTQSTISNETLNESDATSNEESEGINSDISTYNDQSSDELNNSTASSELSFDDQNSNYSDSEFSDDEIDSADSSDDELNAESYDDSDDESTTESDEVSDYESNVGSDDLSEDETSDEQSSDSNDDSEETASQYSDNSVHSSQYEYYYTSSDED